MEENIKKINEVIIWYNTNNPDASQILEAMKRLSGYLWYFAEIVSNCKRDYNEKYFIRRLEIEKSKQVLIKSGLAVNRSSSQAVIDNEDIYRTETEAESVAVKADILLKQGNRVLDIMRTDLSFKKTEANL